MKKKQLLLIAEALQNSKHFAEQQYILLCANNEKPATYGYLKTILIPQIDKAFKIIKKEYNTKNKKNG